MPSFVVTECGFASYRNPMNELCRALVKVNPLIFDIPFMSIRDLITGPDKSEVGNVGPHPHEVESDRKITMLMYQS